MGGLSRFLAERIPYHALQFHIGRLGAVREGSPDGGPSAFSSAGSRAGIRVVQSLSEHIKGDLSWDRFLWARFVTFSRSFTVSRARLHAFEILDSNLAASSKSTLTLSASGVFDKHTADDAYVLTPIADMLNHARGPAVNARWEIGRRGFTVVTKRPVAQGEELFISYGETKDNGVFMFHYGFVEHGNPNEKVMINLRFDPSVQNSVVGSLDDAGLPFQLSGQPLKPEEFTTLMDVFRAHANAEAPGMAEVELEVLALRLLLRVLDREALQFTVPDRCVPVCVDLRENIIGLVDTLRLFARRCLAFLTGSQDPKSDAIAERFVLHARLYFGLWLRLGGKRFATSGGALDEAMAYGNVRSIDIMSELD